MNTLFSLSVVCVVLAMCHGACFWSKHKAEIENGELIVSEVCVDQYDGSKHAVGETWNTAECMKCTCSTKGMQCCSRYGGVAHVKGCVGKIDEKTCQYKFFKANDPSKPCF